MKAKKTLVIFDTNQLRSTSSREISYGSFEFGRFFDEVVDFLKKNALSDYVELAVPRVVIKELINQKIASYKEDIQEIENIIHRLSQLPTVDLSTIELPNSSFDIEDYLNPKVEEFLKGNGFKVIDIEETKLSDIMKSTLRRVFEGKRPFRLLKDKSTDIGFKDVMIWEAILNFNVEKYDQVILVSDDHNAFDQSCKDEFETRNNRILIFASDVYNLESKLNLDYDSIVTNKKWMDFVETKYFEDYLTNELSFLNDITIDGKTYKIRNIQISDKIESVKEVEESDYSPPYTVLTTLLQAETYSPTRIRKILVRALTYLDESRGFDSTDYVGEFDVNG